jgi:hypothetical protein
LFVRVRPLRGPLAMPIFVLWAKAELDGVAKFYPTPGTTWTFDVKQGAGSEERNGVVIDPDEEHEVPNTKGTSCNFLIKFPGDKQHSYAKVLAPDDTSLKKVKIRAQTADDNQMVPLVAFECRGLEPVRWHPVGPYCAETEGGKVYDEVNFVEGDDWCEYDEASETSMTVGTDIEYEFRRG